jgi:hypothetical protein
MDNLTNPKNILFHPCPICKTPMEVELIEVRKDILDGTVDLEAVKKEWRHICTKCQHETSKYIKICSYCNIPDDIGQLKCTQTGPDQTYYHAACDSKSKIPYIIAIITVILLLAGGLVGTKGIGTLFNKDKIANSIKEGKRVVYESRNAANDKKAFYEEERTKAKKNCVEAINLDKYNFEIYVVLGELYKYDSQLKEAAALYKQGLILAKFKKDKTMITTFEEELKKLKAQGIIIDDKKSTNH